MADRKSSWRALHRFRFLSRVLGFCRNEIIIILTIIFLIGGGLVGAGLSTLRKPRNGTHAGWTKREISYVRYPGEIGLNILRGLTVPLLMSSIISSLGSMNMRLGKMILIRLFPLLIVTTFVASWIGIIVVTAINPGKRTHIRQLYVKKDPRPILLEDSVFDLVRNFCPSNIVSAMIETVRTNLEKPAKCPPPCRLENYFIRLDFRKYTNFRGIVLYSIIFGLGVSRVGMYGQPVLAFTHSFAEAMSNLSRWAVWVIPITSASLIAAQILVLDGVPRIFSEFGIFLITVLTANAFYAMTLSAMYYLATRRSPLKFVARMCPALFLAFATRSSLATLPILLRCLDQGGANPRMSRLVIAVGFFFAQANSAIYCSVTGLFLAQYYKKEMSFGKIVRTSLLSWWGSVYVPGTGKSLLEPVTFIAALFSIPPEKAYIAQPSDWLVDAFLSSMNALNYSVLTACVGQFFEKELHRLPPFNQILREGLFLRRLSLITEAPNEKGGPEGEEDNAGNDDIEDHEPKPSFVGVNDQEMDKRIARLRGSLIYGRDEWEAVRDSLTQDPSTKAQAGSSKASTRGSHAAKKDDTKDTDSNGQEVISIRLTRSRRKQEIGEQDFVSIGRTQKERANIAFGSKNTFAKEARDIVSNSRATIQEEESSSSQKPTEEVQSEEVVDSSRTPFRVLSDPASLNFFQKLKNSWSNFSNNSRSILPERSEQVASAAELKFD